MSRFDSTDHLSFEAVAALVDGELSRTAVHRARLHLAVCQVCQNEAARQRAAAAAVREHNTDGCLRAPRSLVERLALMEGAEEMPVHKPSPKGSGLSATWSKLREGLK